MQNDDALRILERDPSGNFTPSPVARSPIAVPMVVKPKKAKIARLPTPKRAEPAVHNHWLEVRLQDTDHVAIPFTECTIEFADGRRLLRRSNEWGIIYLDGLAASTTFSIKLNELDKEIQGTSNKGAPAAARSTPAATEANAEDKHHHESYDQWRSHNESIRCSFSTEAGKQLVSAGMALVGKLRWAVGADDEGGVSFGCSGAPFYFAMKAGLLTEKWVEHFLGYHLAEGASPFIDWDPAADALQWIPPTVAAKDELYPSAKMRAGDVAIFCGADSSADAMDVFHYAVFTGDGDQILSLEPDLTEDGDNPDSTLVLTTVQEKLAEYTRVFACHENDIAVVVKPFTFNSQNRS